MSESIRFDAEGGWQAQQGSPDADVRARAEAELARLTATRRASGKLAAEVAAIFARTGLSAREKLDAFLAIDPSGRPGAPQIRERQNRLRERLARLADLYDRQQAWTPRAARFGARDRDEIRARKSGDSYLAVALGESYHQHVKTLYTSKYARVSYGPGGQETCDWDVYRGAWRGWACRYCDAGARVEYADHPRHRGAGTIVIETARGTEVLRVPLPSDRSSCDTAHASLLDGDLYAVDRRIGSARVAERYGVRRVRGHGWQWYRTGIAVLYPMPDGTRTYWEHGRTIAECREEYARKLALEKAAREKAAVSARLARATDLIARVCGRLVVTLDDAAQCGYCQAGIDAWSARYGFGSRTEATVAELRAAGDSNVERPIRAAAARIARARFSPTQSAGAGS